MEAISTGTFSFPTIVSGRGCWLFDAAGSAYFDGTAGSGAVALGHGHPRVRDAVERQLGRLVHTGCKINSDVRTELVAKLCAISPFSTCSILPAVTGAEAIEASLKIARAYTGRRAIIAFAHAFHGKTTGALSVTWRDELKSFSGICDTDVKFASFPAADADQAELEIRLAEFRRIIHDAGAQGRLPAAVILEPIQVTEGVHIPGRRFLDGIVEIARAAGILVILDEIYTGFGRAGALFYCRTLDSIPDLLVVGKSLGNGFAISAVLGKREVINALPGGIHTSTYSGHPLACAAAASVIDVILETRLWELAARLGTRLLLALRAMAARLEFVSHPRGEGLLLAFDCLGSGGRPSPGVARSVLAAALARRLLLFGGGIHGATIKIVPPMLMSDDDFGYLVETLGSAVAGVGATWGSCDVVQ